MPKDWSRPFSPRQCQTLFVKVCGLSLDDSNLTLGTSIKMEEKQRLRPRKLTKGAHGVVPERKLHPAAIRTSHVNTGLFREAWISYAQVPPQQEQNPRQRALWLCVAWHSAPWQWEKKSLLWVGTRARPGDQVVLNMLYAPSPSLTESQGDINEQ